MAEAATGAAATPAAGKVEAGKPGAGAPPLTPPATNKPGAPPAPPAAKEPTTPVKINGKVYELTQAQLIAAAQKGIFADQRLKSAEVVTGKTAQLIAKLKTPDGLLEVLKDPTLGNSPKEVLRKLMNSDVIDDELKEEIAAWTYKNVVQRAKLSPEEIEREEKLKDYERLKTQEKERAERDLSTKQKAEVEQVYQAVRSEVVKQITADKTFPKTEGAIRSVIDTLRAMNKNGAKVTTDSIAKALSKAKNDHLVHQQAMFDSIESDEDLVKFIGENRALRISRALVARLKSKGKAKAETKPEEEGKPEEKVTDRIDHKLGRQRHGYTVMKV